MSKPQFFEKGTVKYPAKEDAMAFVGTEDLPVFHVVIGTTYPLSEYAISRPAETSPFNLEYVLEGEGDVYVHGEWVRAKAGDTYILRRGERQAYRADARRPWHKLWITFYSAYMDAFLDAYRVSSGVYHTDTSNAFQTLIALSRSGRSYGEICFTIAECIHTIVLSAAATHGESDGERIREALNAAVYKKCDLSDVAAQLHMSKSNLIRVFERTYGVTPYEYLLTAKTDAAKLLLRSTHMRVKEIADSVCIGDEHYFSTLFLRRTGMRPSAYRAALKEI